MAIGTSSGAGATVPPAPPRALPPAPPRALPPAPVSSAARFEDRVAFADPGWSFDAVAVADLNSDGRPDVVAADGGRGVVALLNAGASRFTTVQSGRCTPASSWSVRRTTWRSAISTATATSTW